MLLIMMPVNFQKIRSIFILNVQFEICLFSRHARFRDRSVYLYIILPELKLTANCVVCTYRTLYLKDENRVSALAFTGINNLCQMFDDNFTLICSEINLLRFVKDDFTSACSRQGRSSTQKVLPLSWDHTVQCISWINIGFFQYFRNKI